VFHQSQVWTDPPGCRQCSKQLDLTANVGGARLLTWTVLDQFICFKVILYSPSHMLHVWQIYLQNWMILFGQMLVNIPAPWSICVCMYVYAYIYIWINIYVGKYTESIWKMGEYVKPSFLNSIICSFDWINLEQILQGFNLLPRKRRFTNQLKIPVLLQDWPWVCSYFR